MTFFRPPGPVGSEPSDRCPHTSTEELPAASPALPPARGGWYHVTRARKDSAKMTYCLGIVTKYGLVMASDSRTNAGYDQVNICKKMHTFVQPGERVFVALTSGSLSLTQSILTLLRRDFDEGKGLAAASSLYDGARVIGEQVRRVS